MRSSDLLELRQRKPDDCRLVAALPTEHLQLRRLKALSADMSIEQCRGRSILRTRVSLMYRAVESRMGQQRPTRCCRRCVISTSSGVEPTLGMPLRTFCVVIVCRCSSQIDAIPDDIPDRTSSVLVAGLCAARLPISRRRRSHTSPISTSQAIRAGSVGGHRTSHERSPARGCSGGRGRGGAGGAARPPDPGSPRSASAPPAAGGGSAVPSGRALLRDARVRLTEAVRRSMHS